MFIIKIKYDVFVKGLKYDIRKIMVLKGEIYIYIVWVYIIQIKFLKDLYWFLFEND